MSSKARSATDRVKTPADPLTEGQRLLGRAVKALQGTIKLPAEDSLGRHVGLSTAIRTLKEANVHLTALEQLAGSLKAAADREFQELESTLREECASRSWHISGQWPEFQIAYGAKVVFDEKTRHVNVAGRDVGAVGASTIIDALHRIIQELIPAKFDPSEFLNELSSAYDDARIGNSHHVAIVTLHKTVAVRAQGDRFWRNPSRDRFQTLTADQFRARLGATLVANRNVDSRGRSLRLHPALGSTDALFIYQPAERRYGWVGAVDFIQE